MSCATPRVNIPTEISNTAEQLFQMGMWGSRAEKKKTGLMPQELHMAV